jgi:hypothetical protein
MDQQIILAYVQILLDFRAIRFKFPDWINSRPISFQSAIPKTTQGDKRFRTSWWSVKLCPNRDKCPLSMQGAYFRSYAWSANQHVQISQWLPIDVHNSLLLFTCTWLRTNQTGAPDWHPYFLHTQCCIQKEMGSQSTLHTAYITCSMHIKAYKKQGAPDQRSI